MIQTTEVMATVLSSTMWPGTGVPALPIRKKVTATTKLLTIAAISLQALIRHQNQRSR